MLFFLRPLPRCFSPLLRVHFPSDDVTGTRARLGAWLPNTAVDDVWPRMELRRPFIATDQTTGNSQLTVVLYSYLSIARAGAPSACYRSQSPPKRRPYAARDANIWARWCLHAPCHGIASRQHNSRRRAPQAGSYREERCRR